MYETDKLIERGEQLRRLNRPQEAINELQKALIAEPESEEALNQLVLCYLDLNDYKSAEQHLNKLLTVVPDEAHPYYYKAFIELQRDEYAKAENHILEAISINPYESAFFGLLSSIYIQRGDWKKALQYANEGLAIDPENTSCLNHRTTCLTKLDRYDEVGDSIEEALTVNPYNAYTHANVGWTKLNLGDNIEAKNHFGEALRIDPNFEYARLGMIEAIKSKNPLYRLYLNYVFFMSKYSSSGQMAIIIIASIGRNFIKTLAKTFPILLPVFYLLGFLFYLTWIIQPLGNVFLRLDSYGKLMLTDNEKRSAEVVGVGVLLGVIFGIFYLITGSEIGFVVALISLGIIIPISDAIEYEYINNKKYLALLLVGFLFFCISDVIFSVFVNQTHSDMIWFFVLGIVAYMWLINLGIIKKES
jgi:tetratricopeptide (TPR) repeat protein